MIKTFFILLLNLTLASCGGGVGGSGGGTISGGVCIGSGSSFICLGRMCTKSGIGVICPDGKCCPMPQNLSTTGNPVCAA